MILTAFFLARAPAIVQRMAASRMPPRPSQSTGDAPRRSPPTIRGARRPPHRPPPRTVTAPPTRPAFLFLRAAARLPHECLMSRPARANRRETHRDAAHRQSAVRAAHLTARRHAPSPRPFCSSELPHEERGGGQVEQSLVFCGREDSKLVALRQMVREGLRPPLLIFVQSVERAMQLFHALVYDGLHEGVLHAERTAARGRRRRRTRRAAVARRPTTPRRPTGARRHGHGVLMKPHEPRPPKPIDGRRIATEPTDDLAHAPTTPPAATHRHRAPDATPTSTHATTRPRPLASEQTAALRVLRTSRRLTLSHQTAEPMHSAAPVAAPRPCSAPVCRRSAEALGTPRPCALSASAERRVVCVLPKRLDGSFARWSGRRPREVISINVSVRVRKRAPCSLTGRPQFALKTYFIGTVLEKRRVYRSI